MQIRLVRVQQQAFLIELPLFEGTEYFYRQKEDENGRRKEYILYYNPDLLSK
ncbi:hypothetical protein [Salibacterium lacus]|uniref:Uncharacterized protein n=1 Tax=Salibacterium lacus TaxID=1898109 RepID=A0ABW5T6D9_9BACI